MSDSHNACVVPFKVRAGTGFTGDDLTRMQLIAVDPAGWHEEHDPGEDMLTEEQLYAPIEIAGGWMQTGKMDELGLGVYGFRLTKDDITVWAVNESQYVAGGHFEVTFVANTTEELLAFCEDFPELDVSTLEANSICRCTC